MKLAVFLVIWSLVVVTLPSTQVLAIEIGEIPPVWSLSGKEGGRLSGDAWSSTELSGKLWLVFYVDPDQKDLNNVFHDKLKSLNFPKEVLGTVAVINMAAAPWTPNFLIESSLAEKQKRFTETVYVKDFEKKGVKVWSLKDDSSDVVLLDATGKVLFHSKNDLISPEESAAVVAIIEAERSKLVTE